MYEGKLLWRSFYFGVFLSGVDVWLLWMVIMSGKRWLVEKFFIIFIW